MTHTDREAQAMAVVRRNTEKVQGEGDFALFEELFADDVVDRHRQPVRGARPARRPHRVLTGS